MMVRYNSEMGHTSNRFRRRRAYRELVREVLAAGLGGVELRERRVKCMSAHDWQKKGDSQGGHKSVTLTSDSIVMPIPRLTTRSLWRLRRLVCMREIPSYGTRCRRRTSTEIRERAQNKRRASVDAQQCDKVV